MKNIMKQFSTTQKEFINNFIEKISSSKLKSFPDDFIDDFKSEEKILNEKTYILGEEFFGYFEVHTADGKISEQLPSLYMAKYIAYASTKKRNSIPIPVDERIVSGMVHQYETHIDSIIKEAVEDYKKSFPEEKMNNLIISEILQRLNLVRY